MRRKKVIYKIRFLFWLEFTLACFKFYNFFSLQATILARIIANRKRNTSDRKGIHMRLCALIHLLNDVKFFLRVVKMCAVAKLFVYPSNSLVCFLAKVVEKESIFIEMTRTKMLMVIKSDRIRLVSNSFWLIILTNFFRFDWTHSKYATCCVCLRVVWRMLEIDLQQYANISNEWKMMRPH